MIFAANAKINLTLAVGPRRADGYHLVDTVMHTVSPCDSVDIVKTGGGVSVSCSVPLDCDMHGNTAYKAAAASFDLTGVRGGADIRIEKKIPAGAGLGGGSADAAAVLRGLDRLYGTAVPRHELERLAASVGADVPFCLFGGAAFCTGAGDIVEPVAPAADMAAVILFDGRHSSTAQMYRRLDDFGGARFPGDARTAVRALAENDVKKLAGSIGNDFGAVSGEKLCGLLRSHGALAASLSGSGSAVYGLFESDAQALECARALEKEVLLALPVTLCAPDAAER